MTNERDPEPVSPLRELAQGKHLTLPALGAAVLGLWLAISPWLLGHAGEPQAFSDVASGALAVLLAVGALWLRRTLLLCAAGAVGLWVILSPIVLWAHGAGTYANATLTGCLLAVVGFIVPLTRRLSGPTIPSGWSYNPSTWVQRAPVIVLSALSFVAALYMAAYQLGYIGSVVDPVFGDGTRRVLTSSISQSFPVSDAGLGAATYLIDLIMTCAGDQRRWRTMPWLVIVFGVLIVPVGIVSVVLVMLQPIAVGAWCVWCLVTAVATLVMVPLAIDEVAATLQLLRRVHREGQSWWHVLWHGAREGADASARPERFGFSAVPWNLVGAAGAGLWLILEPFALGTSRGLAISTTITGTLVIVIAAVAASEIARAARVALIPVALWAAFAPWWMSGTLPTAHLSGPLAAAVILAMSVVRGPIKQRRGELDRLARWPAPA